jgi:hypothetical protein
MPLFVYVRRSFVVPLSRAFGSRVMGWPWLPDRLLRHTQWLARRNDQAPCRPLQLADRQMGMGRAAERSEILNARPPLPAALVCRRTRSVLRRARCERVGPKVALRPSSFETTFPHGALLHGEEDFNIWSAYEWRAVLHQLFAEGRALRALAHTLCRSRARIPHPWSDRQQPNLLTSAFSVHTGSQGRCYFRS